MPVRCRAQARLLLPAILALAVCAQGVLAQEYASATANYAAGGQSDVTVAPAYEQKLQTTEERWSIERLPSVDGLTAQPVDAGPKYAQDFPGGLLLPDDDVAGQERAEAKGLPPGMRRAGCFQGIDLGGSWLATGTGNDALGIAEATVSCEFVLPSLVPQSFLTLTPKYGIHRFDSPGNHDIPAEVHDAAVGFGMRGRASDRLSYQANVAVGSYSDFENGSGDQVRIRGYGSGLWKWTPKVDLMFGVAYVDLEDWPVLPIGGLIIRPDECQTLRVTFPRMAYSRRLGLGGTCAAPTEYWGTIGLEMGGGRWVVETNSGTTDEMTYRDWRLTLGLTQKRLDTYDLNFDIGYVFARRIEYEDDHESYAPDDTFSLTLTGRF